MDRLFSFVPYEGSPVQAWFDAVAHYMSPYDLNPLNINPLRDLIERFVDFDAVRACKEVSLFISATNVQTGRLRVFPQDKITADVIMASACLPFLFRAVEIDGVPYWDGGYMGNPAIFPFFDATADRGRADRADQSGRAQGDAAHANRDHEPHQRNHVQFLAARRIPRDRFRHAADRPGQAAARHRPGEYRRINVHRIALDDSFKELDAGSKLNSDFDFFEMLKKGGESAAKKFLDEHFDDIGVQQHRRTCAPRRRPSGLNCPFFPAPAYGRGSPRSGGERALSSSWPGLSRPSTPCLLRQIKNVRRRCPAQGRA